MSAPSGSKTPGAPKVEAKRFEWRIDREVFGKKGLYDGSTQSWSFSCGQDGDKSDWRLQLREDDIWSGYSLYILPDYKNPSRVDIKFKVGVIMKDGTEACVKHGQILSGSDICALGYPRFISGVNFYYEDDEYFRNKDGGDDDDHADDVLTIFCDHEIVRKKSNFSLDFFSRMFDSGKFTDFTLLVGEEEFKVHRAVLASRSPVFEAMFEQNSEDVQSGRLEIKDLDVVGVKGLLEFIYSGDVKDLAESIAMKVLPAAEKYGVDELKTLCEKVICDKFRVTKDFDKQLSTEALEFVNKISDDDLENKERFYELVKVNPKVIEEMVKPFDVTKVEESDAIEPEEKRVKLN